MPKHQHSNSRRLGLALALTLGFAAVEAAAGWWAGSLALLGDAGHMLTDSSALGLAAVAALLARRPATHRHSWGMGRIEILAALVNGLFMLGVVAAIVYGAVQRLQTPIAVNGPVVVLVAAVGLAINTLVLTSLSHDHDNLNVRGAALHVMGDLLGSVAALGAGLVIWVTGWTPIDPILSLVICVLILIASARLLREGLHVVMEGVPRHIDLAEVGRSMAATPGVISVHDLHIWQVTSNHTALSAHVVVRRMAEWNEVLGLLKDSLATSYGVEHVTLQPEVMETVKVPVPDPAGGSTRATG